MNFLKIVGFFFGSSGADIPEQLEDWIDVIIDVSILTGDFVGSNTVENLGLQRDEADKRKIFQKFGPFLPTEMTLNELKYCRMNAKRYSLNKENNFELCNLVKSFMPDLDPTKRSITETLDHYDPVKLCQISCLLGSFPFRKNLNKIENVVSMRFGIASLLNGMFVRKIVTVPSRRNSYVLGPQKMDTEQSDALKEFFDMKKGHTLDDLLSIAQLLPSKICPIFVKYKVMKAVGRGVSGLALKAEIVDKNGIESPPLVIKLVMFEHKGDHTKPYASEYIELRIHDILTNAYTTLSTRFSKLCPIVKLYDWTTCDLNLPQILHPKNGIMPLNSEYEYGYHVVGKYNGRQAFPDSENPTQIMLLEFANHGSLYSLLGNAKNNATFWTLQCFSSFLAQIVTTLYQLNSSIKFTHGDLHTGNVLLYLTQNKLKSHLSFTTGENTRFYIPLKSTSHLICKLNDFGFSYAEILHDSKITRFRSKKFKTFLCESSYGGYHPSYDMHKLCCSLFILLISDIQYEMEAGMKPFIPDTLILDFMLTCIHDDYYDMIESAKTLPKNDAQSSFLNDRKSVKKCIQYLIDGIAPSFSLIKTAKRIAADLTLAVYTEVDETYPAMPSNLLNHHLFDRFRDRPLGLSDDEIESMDLISFSVRKSTRSSETQTTTNILDDKQRRKVQIM